MKNQCEEQMIPNICQSIELDCIYYLFKKFDMVFLVLQDITFPCGSNEIRFKPTKELLYNPRAFDYVGKACEIEFLKVLKQ